MIEVGKFMSEMLEHPPHASHLINVKLLPMHGKHFKTNDTDMEDVNNYFEKLFLYYFQIQYIN